MGGRGGSSGSRGGGGAKSAKTPKGKYGFGVNSSGQSYISADKALYEGETLELTRQYDKRSAGMNWGRSNEGSALEAVSDGNGHITLDYAKASEFNERNRYKTDIKYEIKTGFTIDRRGRTESTGINFDNVTEISGRTYGIGELVKKHGFKWDRDSKVWKK